MLSRKARKEYVAKLVTEAHAFVDLGIKEYITDRDKELAAICILYSGGNDSTVLTHLMRERADFAAHINTTIGIEKTREFVRSTCAAWNLPLYEKFPPISYEELIRERGFPGPGQHYKMYQRLKERGLRQVRRQFVSNGRRQRIVYLGGIRRAESNRRMYRDEMKLEDSVVWISPIILWTNADMAEYRAEYPDVPKNEVSGLLHMSGECLCGAFAKAGERKEIAFWFPEVDAELSRLETIAREAGHQMPRCMWGWGATEREPTKPRKGAVSPLCTTCEWRAGAE